MFGIICLVLILAAGLALGLYFGGKDLILTELSVFVHVINRGSYMSAHVLLN